MNYVHFFEHLEPWSEGTEVYDLFVHFMEREPIDEQEMLDWFDSYAMSCTELDRY
jgi:hypothetical protein